MAESEARVPADTPQEAEKKLKHLDFVEAAVIYVFVCFSTLYEYAKENSGPLKPGVQTIEGTVKTAIGPVCEKFRDVPFELLLFADGKVDDSLRELDRRVPSGVKEALFQLLSATHKAPEVAREVVSELQRAGLVDTAKDILQTVYTKYEPAAKKIYDKYEPVTEQYAVTTWQTLNRLPLFPQVAQILVPTGAYWAEKYNQAISVAAERGYVVSNFLPMIPIDRISKVFEGAETAPAVSTNGESVMMVAQ